MISAQSASFLRDAQGDVCITFEDPAFTRADVVFIDPAALEVTALIDGLHVRIGTLTEDLAAMFMANQQVLLKAIHPFGHEITLPATLQMLH